ncbi:peroxisomal targeting signal 2 receptor [Stomoxys calcitrans]|uniref:peroxisomal targeting signal 2 receptor n=1 Tax=Stomoxys calcitrans TaxID=35570 RepID=UPI0027E38488|nr:peroxisomal targeting signal 2 receptor [Stomoxys calcitrans]XP_013107587.2 peroxisomal targeting signal 2 receptor [Stomoxys calcitrans]XP_013107588.2 peroxisomal targeting signal 2 receptor [Stomoxys calcitrans]
MYTTYTTADRHGYSVKYSTFETDRLLLATSQLYGLAGGGSLFLLQHLPAKGLNEIGRLEWSDGLFDVSWCPYANNIAVTSSGDGSLQIWSGLDADSESAMKIPQKPVMCLREHKNEVYSVDWSEKWNYHQILSASWDGSIKLWDCNRQKSVATYSGHSDLIYSAKFSPFIANIFASVGTDGLLNLWNSFDFSGKPLMSVPEAHNSEILSMDWSKLDRNVLVTGGADGLVRAWDLRNMREHVFELYSGDFAVRRLAFSPHKATVLASANYDFTTRIWDFSVSADAVEIHEHHTEFVCGLDWNANKPHQLADCGWDSVINVFTPKTLKV